MSILIGITIGIVASVLAIKYVNAFGYPSLLRFLMFIAIMVTILLALLALGFSLVFSLFDPIRFRFTKQCDGCVFTFSNVDFSGSKFERAILINSDISGANFRKTNLQKANLRAVRNSPGRRPNFQSANLRESNLSDASLPNIILANAQLQNANLQNADLFGAELSGANLQNANLFEIRLTNAHTLNTDFRGADLRNAKMCFLDSSHMRLDSAKLEGARITISQGNSDFTLAQKKMLKQRGAILGGPSELCY
jgi:uncharacterized protein YjbI with pentapeptide repeats